MKTPRTGMGLHTERMALRAQRETLTRFDVRSFGVYIGESPRGAPLVAMRVSTADTRGGPPHSIAVSYPQVVPPRGVADSISRTIQYPGEPRMRIERYYRLAVPPEGCEMVDAWADEFGCAWALANAGPLVLDFVPTTPPRDAQQDCTASSDDAGCSVEGCMCSHRTEYRSGLRSISATTDRRGLGWRERRSQGERGQDWRSQGERGRERQGPGRRSMFSPAPSAQRGPAAGPAELAESLSRLMLGGRARDGAPRKPVV